MPKSKWTETKIFKEIESREGEYARKIKTLLERPEVMGEIELILDKGGTTPKDFTLHDADHSFRVAERMWDLIPNITQKNLSDYELGLLLLTAYLHDIGMSPDFETVQKHKDYLTADSKDSLNGDEINEFQKWIDNDDKISPIDIRKNVIKDEKIYNYILSYYIRSKHNQWSGDWIKKNLSNIPLPEYRDWVDDLIKVCKSHHYEIDQLSKENFDPKPIGSSEKVHLRYLALCLRVADVMENDPERTPEVILKHRMVSASSLKYWLKDKSFILRKEGNRFIVYARPEKAYLHKAIEETSQWIENELKLCDRLMKIKPLKFSSFAELDKYYWDIEPIISRDIFPKEDTYEYIQGAFKPNTSKILELLGGNQLYGNSIWAYRELIQNAFDAVKEKIAYHIINEDKDPKEFISKIGDLYSINLILDKRNDGFWLVCKDQGVGMTKSIIEKFFLESGSSNRHQISELERKCNERSFNLGRTGQFGIGVLSYFMIAEKIVVKTKRELNTGYHDSESVSWKFEINGTHDFGELSKYNEPINGTEIELKLKEDIEKEILEWDKKFSSFLKQIVIKSPCTLTYSSKLNNEQEYIRFGWTNTLQDLKSNVFNKLENDILPKESIEDKIISTTEKEKLTRNNLLAKEVALEVRDTIDFLFDEGEIENIGTYRIFIPYFKLAKGKSFFYLKEELTQCSHKIFKIDKGYFWRPQFDQIKFSLKGIRIRATGNILKRDSPYIKPIIPNAYIEIDIETITQRSLTVTRQSLILSDDFTECKKFIDSRVSNLIQKNKAFFNNCYGSLNYEVTRLTPTINNWAFNYDNSEKKANLLWKEIEFPVTEDTFFLNFYKEPMYRGKKLNVIEEISDYNASINFNLLNNIEAFFDVGVTTGETPFPKVKLPILIPIMFF